MIFVTGNHNKLREFEDILGIKLDHVEIDLDEIQSVEVEVVAKHKAKQAFEILKQPVLVEDTGLYFEELNSFPGALIKLFIKKVPLDKICNLIKEDRRAEAITCIAYYDGNQMETFLGKTEAMIAKEPRGDGGFGWDPIFIPNGYNRTFAEMSNSEKVHDFMRKEALDKLKEFLIDKKR